jgi:mono/diheme cytochrome c family protein
MKTKLLIPATVVMLTILGSLQVMSATEVDKNLIDRGRYLVATAGCNDCHTAGYPQADGKIPESEWLMGNPVGFQGPWGTTYPPNLRIFMSGLSEQQWMQQARNPRRPPMPWFMLRDMTDEDLRAIYLYVRTLKPTGQAAPAYVAPGEAVNTPYIEFFPKNLPVTAQLAK